MPSPVYDFFSFFSVFKRFLKLSDRQVLLPLELSKTKYTSFKLNRCLVNLAEVSLKINEFKLERMGSTLEIKLFKFVGLNIDENLTWEFYISNTRSKLAYHRFLKLGKFCLKKLFFYNIIVCFVPIGNIVL